MSDTETKNLLDDAVDDEEESDVEDSNTLSSDMGRKQRQVVVFCGRCLVRLWLSSLKSRKVGLFLLNMVLDR